jgi:receptor protein-tyrosine kinase
MLRVSRLFRAGAAPTTGTVADAWKEAAYAGFEDTVRRVCTQCGWTRASGDAGRMLAIGSAVEGEGKSLLSAAMAMSMAQDHTADVLLLECNLIHPTLSHDFGLQSSMGLSDVLMERTDFASSIRLSRMSNLWLLPAGACDDNPSRLLRSQAMAALLEEARSRFAFTVVDLPATLESSDATVLARLTDGMVLVTRSGSTDLRAVEQALQLLAGVTIHGVVLNRWRSALPNVVNRLVTL